MTLRVPGQDPYQMAFRTNPLDPSPVESDEEYPRPAFYDNEARRAFLQLARRVIEEIFGQDYSLAEPLFPSASQPQ